MRNIRLKIADVLKEKGITQTELSKKAGIRQAAISELTRTDRQRVNLIHLEKIAEALDIDDITELLVIENKKEDGNQ